MKLDPDAADALNRLRHAGLPPFESLDPSNARQQLAMLRKAAAITGPDLHEVRDLTCGGVPCRLYRPTAEPAPCIVYAHGGGWVLGDLASHDAFCRSLAKATGAAVLAVDYRLAPEHPFPAALDDLVAVVTALHRDGLAGLDTTRLGIAGDSAGGNLAAVIAMMGRDRVLPRFLAQLLFCPATDATLSQTSHALHMEGLPVNGTTMLWFRDHYAGTADPTDWRLSPLLARSHVELPSTVLVTAGIDPLCDEGLAYARALTGSGVPMNHLHYPGQMHGFMTGNPHAPRAAHLLGVVAKMIEPLLLSGPIVTSS